VANNRPRSDRLCRRFRDDGAFWEGAILRSTMVGGWLFCGCCARIALSILFLVTVRESRASLAARSNETSVPILAAVRT